jgi:phosphate transport system substrate-binding protein
MDLLLRRILQAALLACLCSTVEAGEKAAERAVHLRGTEALLPMAQYMAETYMRDHPGSTIAVEGGGTFRGYKSLLDGTIDIAMVSSGVQENVSDLFKKDSPKLVKTIVGYTAIVPVVNLANPLRDVSVEQLRDVFSGHIKNWKELGGPSAGIVTLVGPPTDGLTATWREQVLGEFHSFSPKGVVTGTEERMRQVARDSHAITFISLGDLTPLVKPLSVASQTPSADKVRDGSYPLSAPLMLVSTSAPTAEAQRFLNFFSAPNKRLRLPGIVTSETLD